MTADATPTEAAPVLVERRGACCHVVLNRPDKRNAFDEAVIALVTDAFRSLARDPGVRAVLVRGAGKDFCAGADLEWMRRAGKASPAANRRDALKLAAMCSAIEAFPGPVIVRVQGNCFGGGLGIVAAADVAMAADDASFAFSEVKLGLVPAVISAFVLRKTGPGPLRRWFLTAERFGAAQAVAMGLCHEAALEAELDARVAAVVERAMAAGPRAVREAKALIRRLCPPPAAKTLAMAADTLARLRSGPEAAEGLAAFLEKRPPSWR